MIVINGLNDFKKAWKYSKEIGKWESWYNNYYLKYKQIFDNQLKYLYRGDITSGNNGLSSRFQKEYRYKTLFSWVLLVSFLYQNTRRGSRVDREEVGWIVRCLRY